MPKYHKLDEIEWNLIRRRYEAGEAPRGLAAEFGVAESTLFRRRSEEQWTRSAPTAEAPAGLAVAHELCAATAAVERAAGARQELGPALAVCPAGGAPVTAAPEARAASAEHLATARRLQRRINQLLSGDCLGASADRQPQAVKDLATALERLQKVERLALGLDTAATPERAAGLVIVIPAKLSPEEWEEQMVRHSTQGMRLRVGME